VEPGTNGAFLFQQNTMRDAMIAGVTLNIFNNHARRVKMANLAQTVNVLQAVILTEGNKLLLTPTYHVMEMYNVHQDALMVPMQFTSPPVEGNADQLPAISAAASRDKSGKLHVSLTNIDLKKTHVVEITLEGRSAYKTVGGRILASGKVQDHNSFDQPNRVVPKNYTGANLSGNRLRLSLPPNSVLVLELE
jgi:alpha-N-arabinofuranosidase